MITHKQGFKCRIYEDDYETSVYDFNNNIRRKVQITNKLTIVNLIK